MVWSFFDALWCRAVAPTRALLVATLLLACAVGAPARGKAKGKARPKRRGPYGASSVVLRPAEAKGEASLRVRSIDLPHRTVVVEVGGFPRAPAGNLFTFTDDRGRKFIAIEARCEEPFPSGTRVCDLVTPEGYERHAWVGIELHLHGLTSSTVAAPRDEVERAYEAAKHLLDDDAIPEAPTPSPTPTPSPSPTPTPTPTPSPPEEGAETTE
jgi:hypothetical protein